MSSNLVAMQYLHGRLLGFQLEICGCSASLLQVPLAIVQVNFCHDMLVLMCSLWVVRRGWVHSAGDSCIGIMLARSASVTDCYPRNAETLIYVTRSYHREDQRPVAGRLGPGPSGA